MSFGAQRICTSQGMGYILCIYTWTASWTLDSSRKQTVETTSESSQIKGSRMKTLYRRSLTTRTGRPKKEPQSEPPPVKLLEGTIICSGSLRECIDRYIHPHTYIPIYLFICAYIYIYICICIYMYVYTRIHVSVYTSAYTYVYIYIYTCMNILYIYICIFAYRHM